jgi:hypothetical protein
VPFNSQHLLPARVSSALAREYETAAKQKADRRH